MPKKNLTIPEMQALGSALRSYDSMSEEEDQDSKAYIAKVMLWMMKESSIQEQTDNLFADLPEEVVKKGFSLSQIASGDAKGIMDALTFNLKSTVERGGKSILSNLYHGFRDLVSGRRPKTAALNIGLTLGGIAAGALIGGLVIPVIGGPAGALIGGILGVLGGTTGFGILGGMVGKWISKKLSGVFFKDEENYKLSTKKASQIKEQFNISGHTQHMINAYMLNRAKSSASPICKHYYESTRQKVLEGNPAGIRSMVNFFCHEMVLLQNELKKSGSPDLYRDIDTVKKILMNLQSSQLPQSLTSFIKQTLGVYDIESIDLNILSTPVTHEEFASKRGSSATTPSLDGQQTGDDYLRFSAKTKQIPTTPDLILHHSKKMKKPVYEVSADMSQVEGLGTSRVDPQLIREARAIYQKTNKADLTVVSGGNDTVAIQLMAAALKANLKPKLDDDEYPENTHDERSKKQQVLTKAYKLAGVAVPKVDKLRYGFRG